MWQLVGLLVATVLIAVFAFVLGVAVERREYARTPGQRYSAVVDIRFCRAAICMLVLAWVAFAVYLWP